MIEFIKGNLLDQNFDILGHQVNCLGFMGKGLAQQIRNRWPEIYLTYKNRCNNQSKELMGTVQYIKIPTGQLIANLFGEYSCYSPAETSNRENRKTDYDSLQKCLKDVLAVLKLNQLKTVGFPDHLGCGLAGGNWEEVVLPMIKNIFEKEEEITCYIVKYQ